MGQEYDVDQELSIGAKKTGPISQKTDTFYRLNRSYANFGGRLFVYMILGEILLLIHCFKDRNSAQNILLLLVLLISKNSAFHSMFLKFGVDNR